MRWKILAGAVVISAGVASYVALRQPYTAEDCILYYATRAATQVGALRAFDICRERYPSDAMIKADRADTKADATLKPTAAQGLPPSAQAILDDPRYRKQPEAPKAAGENPYARFVQQPEAPKAAGEDPYARFVQQPEAPKGLFDDVPMAAKPKGLFDDVPMAARQPPLVPAVKQPDGSVKVGQPGDNHEAVQPRAQP